METNLFLDVSAIVTTYKRENADLKHACVLAEAA